MEGPNNPLRCSTLQKTMDDKCRTTQTIFCLFLFKYSYSTACTVHQNRDFTIVIFNFFLCKPLNAEILQYSIKQWSYMFSGFFTVLDTGFKPGAHASAVWRVHRQTSERQTSETTNVRTTNVRKDKRQKGQTSEATNVGSDKRQKDKHRKRQMSEATNIRKLQNLILLTFVISII